MGLGTGAIIGIGSAISAAGAITGGAIEASSANNAANIQKTEFGVQQANEAPYMEAGTTALGQLASMPAFTAPTAAEAAAEPGEQFQMEQGQLALNNSLMARGIAGGDAAEAMQQYTQGLASTDYAQTYGEDLQTYDTNLGRLQQIAGMGASSTAQVNAAAQNYANNAGQDVIGAGNATAAGVVGASNAATTGIGSYENATMLQQILGNVNPSSYPTNTTTNSAPPVLDYNLPAANQPIGLNVNP